MTHSLVKVPGFGLHDSAWWEVGCGIGEEVRDLGYVIGFHRVVEILL